MKLPAASLALAFFAAATVTASAAPKKKWTDSKPKEWTVIECRWLDEKYADGDSFYGQPVEEGKRARIWRLYGVDCPETDDRIPARLAEQEAYFGVNRKELLKHGRRASGFAKNLLRGGFTAHTRWRRAEGSSKLPRYFAIIEGRAGKSLAEELVAAGLARAYGLMPDKPDAKTGAEGIAAMNAYRDRLEKLEDEARKRKQGIWKNSTTRRAKRRR